MIRKLPPPAHHPLDFSGGDSPRIVMLRNPRREGDILHVHIGGWHSLADKEAMTRKGYSPRSTDLRLTDYQGTTAWMRFSNTFKMYLPTTNTRAVKIGSEYVLDDNSRIGLLDSVPRGRKLKKEQYFDRDVTREMESNCQSWVVRELSRMTRPGNKKFDALGRRFGLRKADGTTLVLQVASGDADAQEKADGSQFQSINPAVAVLSNSVASTRSNGGFYFPMSIVNGATIESVVPSLQPFNTSSDDANVTIGFQAVDNAVDFASDADVTTRAENLTSTVPWVSSSLYTGSFVDGPDLATPLQAIVNRAGWATGQGVCLIFKGNSDVANVLSVISYNNDAAKSLKIAIDYTAAASGVSGQIGIGCGLGLGR